MSAKVKQKQTKAKQKEEKKKEKKKKDVSTFREYAEMIIEVLVIVFFINTFLLQSQTIPTPSMKDSMLIGDHLLVNKVAFAPYLGALDKFLLPRVEIERGMIVTFKGPAEMEKDYVKRVIGLPGETIQIRNKQVFINGKPLDEPYLYFEGGYKPDPGDNFPLRRPRIIDALGTTTHLTFYMNNEDGHIDQKQTKELCERFKDCVIRDEIMGEPMFKIPEGHYFCMGDNRDNSYDSRFWGPLPEEYIIGRPWRVYWSYESTTEEYLTPGLLHKIKDIFKTIINFIPKTRWGRIFKKFE
ncbi:MAG: signal peptidase I [Candidatus Aminicenantes bacterium]|nr:signal peptidase I [Candidatus Aminicenantes bacterium]NIM83887.1 signal peptidase I [Candidatus Aminicenantes bacterium]NIN23351.1 signal peptidase I [Candidatus Aminicenantes bacterium]NIN47053.1 signal peptidase I [Candidatus Aminicenantes bacterium]NIN89977.1 signal peptidase I [Candidatus Aminicenantes bacterium]